MRLIALEAESPLPLAIRAQVHSLQASMMALLGLGPRMLLCALSQLIFQTGAVAEYRLGAVAEIPLGMRKDQIQVKRRRLQALAGLGGISDSSLTKVLEAVRLLPELLTDVACRHDLKRVGEETWKSVGQTDEMELETGGTFTWFHSRPSAVLNFLLATCPVFLHFSHLGCKPRHAHPRHRGESCSMPMKSLLVQC